MNRQTVVATTQSLSQPKQLAWFFGWLAVLWCLLQTSVVAASPPIGTDVETQVDVSTQSVQVAEPFSVNIQVTAPNGASIAFPEVNETWGEFDVLSHQDQFDIPAADGSDQRIWSRQLTLETITTGELELPAVELQIKQGSSRDTLRTETRTIRVVSVLENQSDPMQFRDIRDVVDVSIPQPVSYEWLWWIAGGALGFGFATIAVVALANRKAKMTPRQWAELQFDEIMQSVSNDSGNARQQLDRVDGTLRTFLEWQFSIPAQNQTANELLAALRQIINESDDDSLSSLESFLSNTERVKFAGLACDQEELLQWLNNSRAIVASLDSVPVEETNVIGNEESEEA